MMDTVTQLQSAVVTAAHGEVFLLLDGKRIALSSGDRLPAGSMIETGTDGLLQARNGAGHVVELAANQSVTLAPSGEWGEPSELGHLDPEIAELQQAIAQGEDPTLNFDAPAAGAGEGTGGGGASNSGYVELARDGGATLAEAGFDTAYAKGTEEERPDWLGLRDILTGEDPAPEIGAPSIGSAVHTVYEAELAGGSAHQPGQGAVIQGTFSVELHGLSGEVQIRDLRFTLDADGNVILPEGGLQIETGAGILHITAIRDGVITYSYQLKEAQSHAPGEGNNTLLDTIPLTVTDSRGESASGSLDVTIVDDVPSIIVTGSDEAIDSGTSYAEGNWSHSFGADLPEVASITINGETLTLAPGTSLTIRGQYGTLTVHADGRYGYQANPNASGTEEFTFSITDTDGDSDEAMLTVTVVDSTVKPEGMTFETHDHEVGSSGESVQVLALAEGVILTQAAVDTVNKGITYGQFSLKVGEDGKLALVFTQSEAYRHAEGSDSATFPAVSFEVTDSNGNQTELEVTVTITDSLPSIEVDTPEGVIDSGTSYAEGNWSHSFGADLPEVASITINGETLTLAPGTSLTIHGQYGTLTVHADGRYGYQANPNASGTEEFTFSITDTDGDSDEATLTVTVVDSTVKPEGMTFETHDHEVGSSGESVQVLALAEGVILTQAAVDTVNKGITYGQFSLKVGEDGKLALVFTQSEAYRHAEGSDSATFPAVSFEVTDSNGNQTELEVTVTITDSLPSIEVDTPEGVIDSGTSYAEGNWSHSFGADLPEVASITINGETLTLAPGTSLAIRGQYGTLTVHADGRYGYQANPNASGTEEFTFSITDTDGDSDEATLTVTVVDSTVKPEGMTFETHDHEVGSSGESVQVLALAEGVILTQAAVDAVNKGITYGQFSLKVGEDGKLALVFTQSEAYRHAEGSDSATFPAVSFGVTDSNGNQTELEVTVTITDDVPIATIDRVQVTDTDTGNYYGNVITGQWGTTNVSADWTQISGNADTLGADGASVTHVRMHTPEGSETYIELKPQDPATGDDRLYAVVETEQGTLTLYSDGSYEFNPTYQTIFDPTDTQGGHAESVNGKNTTTLGDYTFTAVNVVLSSDHSFNDIEYDSDLKFDVPGGKGSLGIKGDAGGGPENSQIDGQGDKKGEANDGVKVDFPDAASAIQFDLVYFEPGETVGWAVFDADGHVIDSGTYTRTADNKPILEINSDAPFNSVVIYAVGENTAFNIGAISVATGTVTEDVSFDYVLTDGDGDSSESQLEFVVDKPGQTQGRAAVTARFAAPEPEPTGAFSHLQALIAGRLGVGVEALTLTMMLGYIQQHAGELDVKVSEAMAAEGPLAQEMAQGDALLVSADMSDGAVNAGAEMVAFLSQLQHLTGAVSADPDLLLQTIQSMEVGTLGEVARELELVSFKGGANPLLQGGQGDEVLLSVGANDILVGGAGDDILVGGAGDDVLAGGAGNDILSGGSGADIFVWRAGDEGTGERPAVDRVLDFNRHEGDCLDLRELLQGESGASIDQYLSLLERDGSTVIAVKTTGSGAVNQEIVLEGVSFADLGGGSGSELLNSMLADGLIKVDEMM